MNSGSYEWTPAKDLPAGDNYAIQIVSKDGEVNYTPLLTIKSDAPKRKSPTSSSMAPESTLVSKTTTSVGPHQTMPSGGTITSYSNSTATTKSSTVRPSSTGDAKESAVPIVPADSGAISVVRSPLALVACLVGAIVYFN